jgi:hypothetical protein
MQEWESLHAENIEIVNWDWYPLWHIIMNPQCITKDKGPKFPWSHLEKETITVAKMLCTLKTQRQPVTWVIHFMKMYF